MTKLEYLIIAIANEYINDLTWYYSLLTKVESKEYKNEFIVIKNGKLSVIVNEELFPLDLNSEGQVFTINDLVKIPKEMLKCIDKDIVCTLGYFIVNYILIETPFKGKVKFIEKGFDIGKLEDILGEYLTRDIITIDEYKDFGNNCGFVEKLSRIVTISATEKGIVPPKGIKEFKEKTVKEFDNKHGIKWRKDPSKVVEYEKLLKAFLADWLKDDPADGKFLSGKVKNNAMAKKYLTFGLAIGFEEPGEDLVQVDGSLLEGYPKDPVKLAKMFNTSRSASYDRGNETQKGGATAKDILRATSSAIIVDGDCGVKYGKYVTITTALAKSLVGRNYIVNGKVKTLESIEEVNSNLGKTLELRSPQYCVSPNSSYCEVCMGTLLAKYKTGINLVQSDIGASILTASLKKMHNTQISSIPLEIMDVIR